MKLNSMFKLFFLLGVVILFDICFNNFLRNKKESLEFLDNHTEISITMDGIKTDNYPLKSGDFVVKDIKCNKSVIAFWDYDSWSLRMRNMKESNAKCSIDFVKEYSEILLNGANPELKNNLIPVTIENDGVVKRANLSTEWYSYENKNWANAIILKDENKKYFDGEVIKEADIESYFVWIPRYKYKIFNDGNYQSFETKNYQNNAQRIEVVFENKDTFISMGSKVGEYLSHPAFTNFSSNGLWVAKFETGYQNAKNSQEAQKDVYDINLIEIKPNVYAWRNLDFANMHLNSFHYQRDLDSHMMKNTEWGSVAYLSHSDYGSKSSVRRNNNTDFVTGYSAINEANAPDIGFSVSCVSNPLSCNEYGTSDDITKPYNTPVGVLASTTGNITGIYDMVGGSYEIMLSVMSDINGKPVSGRSHLNHSNFNGVYTAKEFDNDTSTIMSHTLGIDYPSNKYYDSYSYWNQTNGVAYNRRIMGDATGEMGPFYNLNTRISSWYAGTAWEATNINPFIDRGGCAYTGNFNQIFTFSNTYGIPFSSSSFRIVLAF